jgi:hypothetical protein
VSDLASITCPHCGCTWHNLNDVREPYCEHCHRFLGDEAALLDLMTAQILRCDAPLEIVIRASSAFQLAALLQVGLRHPKVRGPVAETGEQFIEHIRAYFAHHNATAVLEVLRRGDRVRE